MIWSGPGPRPRCSVTGAECQAISIKCRLIPRKKDCSGSVGEVICNPCTKAVALKELRHCRCLVGADLDCREPLFMKDPGKLGREDTIGVQTAFAGEQRLVRFIFAHARAKARAVGDVRRIAKDKIEPVLHPLCPVADLQPRSTFEPEASGIGRSIRERPARDDP